MEFAAENDFIESEEMDTHGGLNYVYATSESDETYLNASQNKESTSVNYRLKESVDMTGFTNSQPAEEHDKNYASLNCKNMPHLNEDKVENKSLIEENLQLKEEKKCLEEKVRMLLIENANLKLHFSSLDRIAKAEIACKSTLISELQAELDRLILHCCGRGGSGYAKSDKQEPELLPDLIKDNEVCGSRAATEMSGIDVVPTALQMALTKFENQQATSLNSLKKSFSEYEKKQMYITGELKENVADVYTSKSKQKKLDHGVENELDHGVENELDHGVENELDHGVENKLDHGVEKKQWEINSVIGEPNLSNGKSVICFSSHKQHDGEKTNESVCNQKKCVSRSFPDAELQMPFQQRNITCDSVNENNSNGQNFYDESDLENNHDEERPPLLYQVSRYYTSVNRNVTPQKKWPTLNCYFYKNKPLYYTVKRRWVKRPFKSP